MVHLSRQVSGKPWEDDLEYILWDALTTGPIVVNGRRIDPINIEELRKLHERAAGWWILVDDQHQFVPMVQWAASLED